ncbi:hypothetical protein ACFGVR_13340 [Mucilaginibacter sp. AW1-3]
MNREFTVSAGYKIFYAFLALLMVGGAVFFIAKGDQGNAAIWVLPLFLLIAAMGILLPQLKKSVIVTDTTITNVDLFKTTELAIADIKGVRIGPKGKTIYIESASGAKKISITNYRDLAGGTELRTWLETNFADLNDVDYKDELAHILSDNRLGVSTEERQAQLDRAKYISWAYNGIGVVLFLLSVFYREKEALIEPVLLIFPILSVFVVLVSNGLIKIFDNKKSPYPHIFFGLIPPMLAQLINIGGNHVLSFNNFWIPFVLLSLLIVGVFYYVDRANNHSPVRGQIIIMIFLGGMYGLGSVHQLNRIYDKSPEQVYQATVTDEYVRHGKSTSYNLRLSAWGPQTKTETVSVSHAMYDQTPIGATVTLHLHKGFFNIPWYTVTP